MLSTSEELTDKVEAMESDKKANFALLAAINSLLRSANML